MESHSNENKLITTYNVRLQKISALPPGEGHEIALSSFAIDFMGLQDKGCPERELVTLYESLVRENNRMDPNSPRQAALTDGRAAALAYVLPPDAIQYYYAPVAARLPKMTAPSNRHDMSVGSLACACEKSVAEDITEAEYDHLAREFLRTSPEVQRATPRLLAPLLRKLPHDKISSARLKPIEDNLKYITNPREREELNGLLEQARASQRASKNADAGIYGIKIAHPNDPNKSIYRKPAWIPVADREKPAAYLRATREYLGCSLGGLVGANVPQVDFLPKSEEEIFPQCGVVEIPNAISYERARREKGQEAQREFSQAGRRDLGPILVLNQMVVNDDFNDGSIIFSKGTKEMYTLNFAEAFDPRYKETRGVLLDPDFYERNLGGAMDLVKENPAALVDAVRKAKMIDDVTIENIMSSIPEYCADENDKDTLGEFIQYRRDNIGQIMQEWCNAVRLPIDLAGALEAPVEKIGKRERESSSPSPVPSENVSRGGSMAKRPKASRVGRSTLSEGQKLKDAYDPNIVHADPSKEGRVLRSQSGKSSQGFHR